MAELTEVEKNDVSHRARACRELRPVLERMIAERDAAVRTVDRLAGMA
jgi:hypothetical protein